MNKRKIGILGLVFVMTFFPKVHAACDYDTQNKLAREAANVQVSYESGMYGTGEFEESEVIDENGNPISYEIEEAKVEAAIYNVTENLSVVVENKVTGEEQTYHYEDTDNGTIKWNLMSFDQIMTYEIRIYANHADCSNELRKMDLVLPKYNYHYTMPYCIGVNSYYCQEWITTEINMSDAEVEKKGYEEQQKTEEIKKNEEEEKQKSFFEKYWMYLIGSFLVILGVAAIVILIKKQRSKVL